LQQEYTPLELPRDWSEKCDAEPSEMDSSRRTCVGHRPPQVPDRR